jgi:hypothetical protein
VKHSQPSPIEIERASEQIRQERESFDQLKSHGERWFKLRLVMGYSSVILLAAVMAVSGYILMNPTAYPTNVLGAASAAMFVDVIGLLVGVWRIAINPKSVSQLAPVTSGALPKGQSKKQGVRLPSGAGLKASVPDSEKAKSG